MGVVTKSSLLRHYYTTTVVYLSGMTLGPKLRKGGGRKRIPIEREKREQRI